ncbi:MAG: hypothetical protein ACOYK9_00250 [Chlamydiia bacterium]
MTRRSKFLFQIGRTLFALPFIIFFVLKLMNWQSSMDSLDHAITVWKGEVSGNFLGSVFNFLGGVQLPLMLLGSALELIGGLMLLIGIRTRLAGALLALFLFFVTFGMHPFWFMDSATMFPMLSDFLKNAGLLGAALIFASHDHCSSSCHCCEGSHSMDDRI